MTPSQLGLLHVCYHQHPVKRRRRIEALIIGLVLLIAGLLFVPHMVKRLRSLNASEREHVGRWVDLKPDEALLLQSDVTFTADKRFAFRHWGRSPVNSTGTWFIDNDTLHLVHGNIWRPNRFRIKLAGHDLLPWNWLNAPQSKKYEWESQRIPLDYVPPDLDWPNYPPVPPPFIRE